MAARRAGGQPRRAGGGWPPHRSTDGGVIAPHRLDGERTPDAAKMASLIVPGMDHILKVSDGISYQQNRILRGCPYSSANGGLAGKLFKLRRQVDLEATQQRVTTGVHKAS